MLALCVCVKKIKWKTEWNVLKADKYIQNIYTELNLDNYSSCLQVFFDLMRKIAAQKAAENNMEKKEDIATKRCCEIL